MTTLLIACLLAFGGSLVFAMVLNNWRQRIDQATADPPVHLGHIDEPMVTLVVPARNAQDTIAALLQDLHTQVYPKEACEVIVVDDASEDGTAAIVHGMMRSWPQLRLCANDGIGKKAAITTAVRHAHGELVLMTDADARCGPDRLRAVVEYWQHTGAELLLLPVRTAGGGGFLGRLQEEEQFALLGAAVGLAGSGSPLLAYGANMAFARAAFDAVGGYAGDTRASGDDVFLLERMRRNGKRAVFALDQRALVTVQAETGLAAFLSQRLRWAGKMRGLKAMGNAFAALALLWPWALLALSVFPTYTDAVNQGLFRCALLLASAWLMWLVPVVALVNVVKGFFAQPRSSPFTAVSLLLFSMYAPIIAVVAMFVRTKWKGRSV